MAAIKNLTPHALVLLLEDPNGEVAGSVGFGRSARPATFRVVAELASEGVARAVTTTETVGQVELAGEQFPVTRTTFGSPQDLPEPDGETTFVVSLVTAQAAQAAGRTVDDLMIVGETVRGAGGNIVGATGFGRL
jgi:hypothetical protein